MNGKVFTIPEKFGPGIWFKIHMDAANATTPSLKEAFVSNINYMADNFKCDHCKKHFQKYLQKNPPETYFNQRDKLDREIGLFKWSWELHNFVNKFLNKPQISFEDAYKFYTNSDDGVCFDCGATPSDPPPISRSIPPIITFYRKNYGK